MLVSVAILGASLPAAQDFVEGSSVSGQGCIHLATGSQECTVTSSVATFRRAAEQRPKQGETFFVVLNVAEVPHAVAEVPHACGNNVTVRPGFKLPAGVEPPHRRRR